MQIENAMATNTTDYYPKGCIVSYYTRDFMYNIDLDISHCGSHHLYPYVYLVVQKDKGGEGVQLQ